MPHLQRLTFFILMGSLLSAANLAAQWTSDSTQNTLVCSVPPPPGTGGGIPYAIVDDDSGWCVIAWMDSRSHTYYRGFLQRFDQLGYMRWASEGVPVSGLDSG